MAAFEGRGELLQRRISLLVGALGLFAVHLASVAMGAPSWARVVYVGLATTVLAAFASDAYRVRRRGTVRADAEGLRLEGALVARRESIASAFVLSADDALVRVVRRRALAIDVRVEEESGARALVAALGFGIGQSIATFRARYGGRYRMVAAGIAGGLIGAGASIFTLHWGPLTGMMAVSLGVLLVLVPIQLRTSANVDVGSDGVLLRRLGEQRFLSFAVIDAASASRGGIELALRGGERVRLTLGVSTAQTQSRDALLGRIEEARAAFVESRELETTETAEALVAPGGRGPVRWIRELRALASARDYRAPRLDADRLWRVVDDPRAPAAARAGAAVALSAVLDEPARTRLRIASEACADPKLRVALARVSEAAADEDVEQALASLLEEP